MKQDTIVIRRSGGMFGLAIIFLGSLFFTFVALWFYHEREEDFGNQTVKTMNEVRGESKLLSEQVAKLDGLLANNMTAVSSQNDKIAAYEKEIAALKQEIRIGLERVRAETRESSRRLNGQINVFRDQVEETRDKQYQIREELSRQIQNTAKQKSKPASGPIYFEIMGSKKMENGNVRIKAQPLQPKPKVSPAAPVGPSGPKTEVKPGSPLGRGLDSLLNPEGSKDKKDGK